MTARFDRNARQIKRRTLPRVARVRQQRLNSGRTVNPNQARLEADRLQVGYHQVATGFYRERVGVSQEPALGKEGAISGDGIDLENSAVRAAQYRIGIVNCKDGPRRCDGHANQIAIGFARQDRLPVLRRADGVRQWRGIGLP